MEQVPLPTYETLLTEAIKSLAIDSGIVSSPVAAGNNTLSDQSKRWATDVLKNRIVKVIKGTGAGQQAAIAGNALTTLRIRGNWIGNIGVGATYVILGMDVYQVLCDALGGPISGANPLPVASTVGSLSPLNKGIIHNTAVLANTDFFVAALTPTNTPCLFRVVGGFSAAGILNVTITRGGNTQTQSFNHAVVLVPNALFMFDHFVNAGDTINYQYTVAATIQTFKVQEIPAATQ